MTSTHPYKIGARRAVAWALRHGMKALLDPQPCELCGRSPWDRHKGRRIVQAHHDSYEPGDWLDVRWGCSPGKCHAEMDAERKGKA